MFLCGEPKTSIHQRGSSLTHFDWEKGYPSCTNYTCTYTCNYCARMRTRPHANFHETSSRGSALDLSSLPPIVPQYRIQPHKMTFFVESTATFFRKSTPRRPSALTTVAPIFTTPRSQLRDHAGRCNGLPTIALCIVILRFISRAAESNRSWI